MYGFNWGNEIGEVSWVHKQNHYRESFHIFPADSRNNTARLINKRCVLWLPSEPTKCQMYCSSSPFIFLLVAFSRGKETTPTLTQDPSHTTMQHGKTQTSEALEELTCSWSNRLTTVKNPQRWKYIAWWSSKKRSQSVWIETWRKQKTKLKSETTIMK